MTWLETIAKFFEDDPLAVTALAMAVVTIFAAWLVGRGGLSALRKENASLERQLARAGR